MIQRISEYIIHYCKFSMSNMPQKLKVSQIPDSSGSLPRHQSSTNPNPKLQSHFINTVPNSIGGTLQNWVGKEVRGGMACYPAAPLLWIIYHHGSKYAPILFLTRITTDRKLPSSAFVGR